MSGVTHGKCSCRDAKREERIFEACSLGFTGQHPTTCPLVRREMSLKNVVLLGHVNAIQTAMISGARPRRVAEKRGDRGPPAKYHNAITGRALFHPRTALTGFLSRG